MAPDRRPTEKRAPNLKKDVILLGRTPLIPLFLAGNATPTIPHKYSKSRNSGFQMDYADTAAENGRSSSNDYEVNPWLWQFGRGKRGLTVEEIFNRKGPLRAMGLLGSSRPAWQRQLQCARRGARPRRYRRASSAAVPRQLGPAAPRQQGAVMCMHIKFHHQVTSAFQITHKIQRGE